MKNAVRGLLVVASLLGSATVSSANIIVNGSFENPDCDVAAACGNGSWGLFDTIDGWTSPTGLIEIGEVSNYGITGQHGDQVLELGATSDAFVAQVVAGAGDYVLSFLFADRVTTNSPIELFQVYWNGTLLPVPPALPNPPTSAMQFYSQTVTALGGNNTLEFRGNGPANDSFGALIDNVQLNAVPDGGVTAMLLGIGVFGLARIRRMLL